MNHDAVMAMDEQQLVEATMKKQGWTCVYKDGEARWFNQVNYAKEFPDYLHSLDACFELLNGKAYTVAYNPHHTEPAWAGIAENRRLPYSFDPYATGDTLNIAILRAYLLQEAE